MYVCMLLFECVCECEKESLYVRDIYLFPQLFVNKIKEIRLHLFFVTSVFVFEIISTTTTWCISAGHINRH